MSRLPRLLLLLAATSVSACSHYPGNVRPFEPLSPVPVPMAATALPSAGAIYRPGPGLNLYADRRARDVGDLLTISLIENTSAQTDAATQIDKSGEITLAAPNLAGLPLTYQGRNLLSASATGERGFNGKGKSSQSNRLQGSLTVTVIQRLPNGNLVIQGEKNMRLNQGDELVQIQGIVRQADIGPDNSIASGKVAQARIVYGGRGAMAQSNAMGWLGRFFNSPLYPN